MYGPELVDQVKKNGFVWYAENWKHNNEFHHHHKAQLVFVESGYQYLHTTNNQFLLPQHHAAWIPSNLPHKTTSASESVSLRTLYFNTDGMPPFYDDLYLFSVPAVLREMIMYTEKWSLNMEYRQSEQTFLLAILEELPSFIQESIPLITPVPKSANLLAVTAYIHNAYHQLIAIEDLAAKGFVSVRTLERQFKKETGISLAKYIQMVRIIKSLELLSEGNLNISEIAFRVGYSSAQSYSNVFTKLLGKRPSEYFESGIR
ncbi:AraC family transcriptional regulator [Myroides sp. 1354]|uniref:AraC family transcriptional regulator n=1 Tax=unclassified Myroides TaxID=2642485 RepID=UPI002578567D|nr:MULTISPECIES: AraC family transcriptional regulator [unclassified Myroides]MDM1045334.1 AraC family transcriptional regulator [Myroides sp. R163-1]MDM1056429.1 AraC family transcriptional regulator [Myroides sp. 1354]MDM1069465.1 AraC family transcriptional regulator [Myroides sp. 1372]